MRVSINYFVLSMLGIFLFPVPVAGAIVDPLSVPNNKLGIHIIHPTPDESSPAATLVNTNGDWGYVTILIESKDRDHNKWQEFFNDLRKRHLIPIVRLATKAVGEYWERPYEGEEKAWADFLDNLNWPVKNRYVIVYNEPNHGKEWGNFVDPKMYAKVLNRVITELKSRNRDYFVLNGGFDASAPHQPPQFFDEVQFLKEMEKEVPGVLNKLDGWVSHSYPNPAFAGSPDDFGRGTVRTWYWELQFLRSLGVTKNLPIFITETGWKHAEGLNYDLSLPSTDLVAQYYKNAFENAWNNEGIVAVTPFLLSYQEAPFDHFSFKKPNGSTDYYPQFDTIKNLVKVKGQPIQENRAQLTRGEIYSSIVAGETYNIYLTFKNTGQSIWNGSITTQNDQVRLVPIEGGQDLGIGTIEIPNGKKVEPGQEYTFNIVLKAPQKGSFKVALNLFQGNTQFESAPVEFITEVKLPVILQVISALKWKKTAQGEYILKISGAIGDSSRRVYLDSLSKSPEIEARYLLPNYAFDFTLEKPFYKSKTVRQKVSSGVNTLDFGTLEPDIISALLQPSQLWKLLPFSE